MGRSRLNLSAIESSLRAVQEDFAHINRTLSTPRDPMTDEVRANMMAGYRCVDDALANGIDLFEVGHSKRLLELNTLVLCGTDKERREQWSQHVALTEKRFYEQKGGGIAELMAWLQEHRSDDVWKSAAAAGAYIHILSSPQLFIEGNHRTGALVMSYILAREGRPPFVLSVDNAKAYFDPSTLVKETKRHGLGKLIKLPKLKKRLAKLLEEKKDNQFLV
jgi:prophage maintenance system killer protein